MQLWCLRRSNPFGLIKLWRKKGQTIGTHEFNFDNMHTALCEYTVGILSIQYFGDNLWKMMTVGF